MRLLAFNLSGTPISDLLDYNINDLNHHIPYITAEDTGDISPFYLDVSSIKNWYNHGFGTKDYKVIRKEIFKLVISIGWNSLDEQEKRIAATLFVVDQSKRDEVFTIDEQIGLGFEFHMNSKNCRNVRIERVVTELYNRLSKSNADVVVSETQDLVQYYIERGREGTEVGDPTGLYDYVQSTSTYLLTGFKTKLWSPVGMTMSQLSDKVMEIIRDGNY